MPFLHFETNKFLTNILFYNFCLDFIKNTKHTSYIYIYIYIYIYFEAHEFCMDILFYNFCIDFIKIS